MLHFLQEHGLVVKVLTQLEHSLAIFRTMYNEGERGEEGSPKPNSK